MKAHYKVWLGFTSLIACMALAAFWVITRLGPEKHARSCLIIITELTDRTLNVSIPQGRYLEAIEAAEYIEAYYPVGTVLPKDHTYADEYTKRRSEQIDRILDDLRKETGFDFGADLVVWKMNLANKPPLDNP